MKTFNRSSASWPWTIAAAIGVSVACGCSRAPAPAPATNGKAVPAPAVPTAAPATASAPAPSGGGVASDGFPTGQQTAEGVAADLARAFIQRDSAAFRRVCLKGTENAEYTQFMANMVGDMDKAKAAGAEAGGPTKITKIFKARNLSADGPASAGYAMYKLLNVQFVDVETPLHSGELYTNRTLVVQLEGDSLWYAIPKPEAYPLLAVGLNSETASTELWVDPKAKALPGATGGGH